MLKILRPVLLGLDVLENLVLGLIVLADSSHARSRVKDLLNCRLLIILLRFRAKLDLSILNLSLLDYDGGVLGSPPMYVLLNRLQPRFVFLLDAVHLRPFGPALPLAREHVHLVGF